VETLDRTLERFLRDPDRFAQHYPFMRRAGRMLEVRNGAPRGNCAAVVPGVTVSLWAMAQDDDSEADDETVDIAISPAILKRHAFITKESRRILRDSSKQLAAAGITARPSVGLDRSTVIYDVAVQKPKKLDLDDWGFQVAHFLYDVRAILDNIMWLVVHDQPLGTLTVKQEKGVYLPLAREEARWNSFLGEAVAKVIRPTLMKRLEDVQPFNRPNDRAMSAFDILSKIHTSDKHRVPMSVELHLDALMPPPLLYSKAKHADGEMWVQLGNLDQPLADGMHLKTFRFVGPIQGEPRSIELWPVPMVRFQEGLYDLQEVMWDAQGALLRVLDTVCLGNTFRADLWDADIAWRRESVEALNRSLANGTNEWEERGFGKGSPFKKVYKEFKKDDPDFDKVFPIDLGPNY
jgi:hypothetical protein